MKLLVLLCLTAPTSLLAPDAVHSPRGAEAYNRTAAVTLAWDAPPGGAERYRVYYRKAGATYSRWQEAGTNLSLRVVGLERKTTYRFVCTAWRGDLESEYSDEVSYRTAYSPSDR